MSFDSPTNMKKFRDIYHIKYLSEAGRIIYLGETSEMWKKL